MACVSKYEDVILGYGELFIDDVSIGITRDNGEFKVERTYHQIKRNGSRGMDFDSMVLDEERAKLKFSILQLDANNLVLVFPGLKDLDGVISPTFELTKEDYKTVKWIGKTKNGDPVTIELFNAFNASNIDWALIDKDEVKQEVEFEAGYCDDSTPYNIKFVRNV